MTAVTRTTETVSISAFAATSITALNIRYAISRGGMASEEQLTRFKPPKHSNQHTRRRPVDTRFKPPKHSNRHTRRRPVNQQNEKSQKTLKKSRRQIVEERNNIGAEHIMVAEHNYSKPQWTGRRSRRSNGTSGTTLSGQLGHWKLEFASAEAAYKTPHKQSANHNTLKR